MKQITFEVKPGAGAMFLDDKGIIKISPDDYDKLKDSIGSEHKHGYIVMAGTIISSNTYNYEFTKDDYKNIINYIQSNFLNNE